MQFYFSSKSEKMTWTELTLNIWVFIVQSLRQAICFVVQELYYQMRY